MKMRGLVIALALVGFIVWPWKPVPPEQSSDGDGGTVPPVILLQKMTSVSKMYYGVAEVSLIKGRSYGSVRIPVPPECHPESVVATLQYPTHSAHAEPAVIEVGYFDNVQDSHYFKLTLIRWNPEGVMRSYRVHWQAICADTAALNEVIGE